MLALMAIGSPGALAQAFERPPALRNLGIDQKLNGQLPLDLTFTDESGATVPLGKYFRGKPVVLSLVYYQCPMLCNLMLNGQLRAFRKLPLEIGDDFEVVTVSFDPAETPAMATAKKAGYIERYERNGGSGGWHFLTGRADQIRMLADAVGFRYGWDESTKQWAHASGIMVATPEGRLARYIYGVEYASQDLRLSLVEASNNKIGTPTDQILLFCFHYDPSTGKYTVSILNTLRAAGSATLLAMGLFVFVHLRRDRSGTGKRS